MFFNLPTLLTWARIAAIPLIVAVFYWPGLEGQRQNLIATVLFVVFAATDWADGYLARKLNQTSSFGAFLDPVADKFLVCASLLILLEMGRVSAIVGLIIIGREIAISALREWMAKIGAAKSVAVSMLGKVKNENDNVFARYIEGHGRPGDCLVALSTSGTSKNVIKAADMAENAPVRGCMIIKPYGYEIKDGRDIYTHALQLHDFYTGIILHTMEKELML